MQAAQCPVELFRSVADRYHHGEVVNGDGWESAEIGHTEIGGHKSFGQVR
jgi:hypothetical protein